MRMINFDEECDLFALLEEASRIKRWTQIETGKYAGLTIPELVFLDLSYFYWALSVGLFKMQVLREANLVETRLRHIKVPCGAAAGSVFVIELRDGIFRDFAIRTKAKGSARGQSGFRVASHLDLSIVSPPNFGTNGARSKMMARVKEHFFTKEPHRLGRADYEAFLGNPDNFETGCHKKHLPDIPRWDDLSILAQTRSDDAAEHMLSPTAIKRIEAAMFFKAMREREFDND